MTVSFLRHLINQNTFTERRYRSRASQMRFMAMTVRVDLGGMRQPVQILVFF